MSPFRPLGRSFWAAGAAGLRPAPCAPRAVLPTSDGLALVAFPHHQAGALRRLHTDYAALGPR
eukprot:1221973-Pyramimonas_sp.AAC.1